MDTARVGLARAENRRANVRQVLELVREDGETTIHMAGGVETIVRMPKFVLDCPCTISVLVAKTHDVCVVTLAQRNMIMGTLHEDDRIKMHGYPSPDERMLLSEA